MAGIITTTFFGGLSIITLHTSKRIGEKLWNEKQITTKNILFALAVFVLVLVGITCGIFAVKCMPEAIEFFKGWKNKKYIIIKAIAVVGLRLGKGDK